MVRYFIIGFFILTGLSCDQKSDFNNSGTTRIKRVEKNFNEDWEFIPDSLNNGEKNSWYRPGHKPEQSIPVSVPHTWNVMNGLEEFYGNGWYFKAFNIPEEWGEDIVRLRFSAIYRDATIWLNGYQVLKRVGAGYTPFEITLDDHVHYGKENYLAIKVSNHFSSKAIPYERKFDWAADGGIIRNVTLIKTESPSIEYIHITPEINLTNRGTIRVMMKILNRGESAIRNLDLWIRVKEYNQPGKEIIYEGNRKTEVVDNTVSFELQLEGIKSWHFHSPNLYKLTVAIGDKFSLSDHLTSTFGFRSFTVHDNQILFNGEPVRLPGIEWMPGSFPDKGLAEDTASMEKMLKLLKGTNAVLTRFHWQQDKFILDWCDRKGILVQEEIPYWQAPYPDQLNDSLRLIIDTHLQEMTRAHYNHPSIVSWGIGNESMGQNKTIKMLLKDIRNKILNVDSTRLINYVSNTFHQNPVEDATLIGHIPMWNDYTGLWYNMDGNGITEAMLPDLLNQFSSQVPDKPLIISEYGLPEPAFSGGDPRRIEHFRYHTGLYEKQEFIAGCIYFSLNDYRTHMGEAGTAKTKRRVHGITNLTGQKKPSYDVIRDWFTPIEDLEVHKTDKNVVIRGKNKTGIPEYTLRNFMAKIYGNDKDQFIEELIPVLKPGQRFNIPVEHMEGLTKVEICTPTGEVVITLDL